MGALSSRSTAAGVVPVLWRTGYHRPSMQIRVIYTPQQGARICPLRIILIDGRVPPVWRCLSPCRGSPASRWRQGCPSMALTSSISPAARRRANSGGRYRFPLCTGPSRPRRPRMPSGSHSVRSIPTSPAARAPKVKLSPPRTARAEKVTPRGPCGQNLPGSKSRNQQREPPGIPQFPAKQYGGASSSTAKMRPPLSVVPRGQQESEGGGRQAVFRRIVNGRPQHRAVAQMHAISKKTQCNGAAPVGRPPARAFPKCAFAFTLFHGTFFLPSVHRPQSRPDRGKPRPHRIRGIGHRAQDSGWSGIRR